MSVQKAIPLKTKGSISGILWHCCPNQQLVKELKPAIMLVVLRCYRKHLLKTPKLCLSSLPTFSHPLQPLLQGGFTPRVLSHKFVWFQTKLVSDLLKTFWKKLDWIPLPNHLPGEKNLIISQFQSSLFLFSKVNNARIFSWPFLIFFLHAAHDFVGLCHTLPHSYHLKSFRNTCLNLKNCSKCFIEKVLMTLLLPVYFFDSISFSN